MEVKAHLNYMHIAPRKVRLVANLIKGMDTRRAELELSYLPKRSSLPILKLLKSAIANAIHNFQLSGEGLYIKEIQVNSGTMLKRSMPRAFGRSAPIRKRTSHISLVLDTRQPVKSIGKTRGKKEDPIIRDITKEDIKEEFLDQAKDERPQFGRISRGKSGGGGFVKKIFQRKAI